MVKQEAAVLSPLLVLTRSVGSANANRQSKPLRRQLYEGLRDLLLDGRIEPGAQLPATRVLARELGVSRTMVVQVFEQLMAEGYLTGQVGAGTFVSRSLPDDLLSVRRQKRQEPLQVVVPQASQSSGRQLSGRGAVIIMASKPVVSARDEGKPRAFRTGVPALDAFPWSIWRRVTSESFRHLPLDLFHYSDPAGYAPLREAIAGYLGLSRGVRCTAQQVIIVSGSQQALDLIARILLDPGDSAWVEEPGYMGARAALIGAGARVVPVPVDDEGLDVVSGATAAPHARLVYVTPSHQYPLGVTMSINRRLAMLEWAHQHGAWIVEDDYDSEYRYSGYPIPAVQGLDLHNRVIYVGTFSKVLFPGLRLGYLVVPEDLGDPFTAARSISDRQPPALEQVVVARFIEQGHFMRHVRRMRQLYAERQEYLLELGRRELAGLLELAPGEAGMHMVGWLPRGTDDRAASRSALANGVEVRPLSAYAYGQNSDTFDRPGLVLGYSGVSCEELAEGVRRLAASL
jgi:GntR family transcriptional regulator/MocR family aminotransferase